jgi:hypothetical protein
MSERAKALEKALRDIVAYDKRSARFSDRDSMIKIARKALGMPDKFVIQSKFDGSFYRATLRNSRDNEESISYTNNINYAHVFESKNDNEFEKVIAMMGEEGYDYRLMSV